MSRHRFIRSAWGVSALTLLSRILGLIRDKALVLVFGASGGVLDAFFLAFTIPNLFRRLFGEGALSGAFIPVFVDLRENDSPATADRLAGNVTTALTLLLSVLTLLGMVGCGLAARTLGPESEHHLALILTCIMLPFMLCICVSALFSGMLQSLRIFALPAMMPVLLNLIFLSILGVLFFNPDPALLDQGIYWVAVGVVAAGLLQVFIQFPALRLKGVALRPRLNLKSPALHRVLKAMGPTVLGLAVFQINVLIDRLIAYLLIDGSGALTHLYLGNRLMQLPLALFAIAIATTSFPDLISHLSRKEWEPFLDKLGTAVRFLCFVMLPATAGLIALADPIIRMIFQEPDLLFDDTSVYRTALVLACYAPGLLFIGLQQILTRVFYALGDTRTPVRVTTAMVAVNVVLNLLLIRCPDLYKRWFATEQDLFARFNEGGLALATTLSALLTAGLLWAKLHERLRNPENAAQIDRTLGHIGTRLLLILISAIATGVVAWLTARSIPYGPELLLRLERGLIPVIVGVATYVLVCTSLPVPEFHEFFARRRKNAQKNPAAKDGA